METSSLDCKKAAHTPAHCSPCSPPPPPPPAPSAPLTLLSSAAAALTSLPATEASAKDGEAAEAAVVVEDDKDRIVVEIMQMYSKQQEKLHSTLHKQFQLEMVRPEPQSGGWRREGWMDG